MPTSPKWKLSSLPKVSLMEQNAIKHVANTTTTFSSGFEKPAKNFSIGLIKFDRQLERKVKDNGSPHESRFEPFDNSPPISTNYSYLIFPTHNNRRPQKVIPLDKNIGRGENVFITSENGMIYNPNFELNHQSIKNRKPTHRIEQRSTSICKDASKNNQFH